MAIKNKKHYLYTFGQVSKHMKKILVLGGTGAMGRHLVELLADRGDKVTVTTRSSRKSTSNIEYIQGNARDESFLYPLLDRQWDAVIDFMIYTTPTFKQRIDKLLASTAQYIFLSSARVYADSQTPIVEATTPRLLDSSNDSAFLATDEYSLAKDRQENVLEQSGQKNWTIIRPYITYSEQRLQLGILEKESWLYRATKGRTIVFSSDIAHKLTTLTYGYDVAEAMAALIGEKEALAEAYHITQGKAYHWHNILDIYLNILEKKLGKRPQVLMLDMEKFSRCKQAEYQIKYDRLFNRAFDNTKISEFVDLEGFEQLEQGLTQCLNAFLLAPDFLPVDWRSEAIMDRYSGELANIKEFTGWKQLAKYLLYRFVKK